MFQYCIKLLIKKSRVELTHLPNAAYMCQWTGSSLGQVMDCRLFGVKPIPEPMLAYCQLDWDYISIPFGSEFNHLHSRKWNWKYRFVQAKGGGGWGGVQGTGSEFKGNSFVLRFTLSRYSLDHNASDCQVLPNRVLRFSDYGLKPVDTTRMGLEMVLESPTFI